MAGLIAAEVNPCDLLQALRHAEIVLNKAHDVYVQGLKKMHDEREAASQAASSQFTRIQAMAVQSLLSLYDWHIQVGPPIFICVHFEI